MTWSLTSTKLYPDFAFTGILASYGRSCSSINCIPGWAISIEKVGMHRCNFILGCWKIKSEKPPPVDLQFQNISIHCFKRIYTFNWFNALKHCVRLSGNVVTKLDFLFLNHVKLKASYSHSDQESFCHWLSLGVKVGLK